MDAREDSSWLSGVSGLVSAGVLTRRGTVLLLLLVVSSSPDEVDLDSCGAENFLVSDLSDALAEGVVGDVEENEVEDDVEEEKAFEGDLFVVVIVAGESDAGMDTK
jgi:hypothetical protein